jgi:hypothetical protein
MPRWNAGGEFSTLGDFTPQQLILAVAGASGAAAGRSRAPAEAAEVPFPQGLPLGSRAGAALNALAAGSEVRPDLIPRDLWPGPAALAVAEGDDQGWTWPGAIGLAVGRGLRSELRSG